MNGHSAVRMLVALCVRVVAIKGRMADRVKRRSAMSLIFALGAMALVAVPAQGASQDLMFAAAADAYIDETAPTAAKGAAAPWDCLVNDDVGARRECRMRFVVSGIQPGDTITSAKVLIRPKAGVGSKQVNMSTVAATPVWDESTITWNNKSLKAALQGSDVSHITGKGKCSDVTRW